MAKEPEPQSTGQGTNPSFSVESQLNSFRSQLDQVGVVHEIPGLLTLPGFLFRDSKDRGRRFSPSQLDALRENDTDATHYMIDGEFGLLVVNNEDILAKHAETYRKALEARSQLLDRIKPVEIIEMVRDMWGKGEIKQTEEDVTLTYPYLKVEEEWVSKAIHHGPFHSSFPDASSPGYTTYVNEKTGKWCANTLQVRERVGVYFGNSEFHPSGYDSDIYTIGYDPSLSANGLADFFADGSIVGTFYGVRVPKEIWRRPDNLGILVTVPYVLIPRRNVKNFRERDGIGQYVRSTYESTWFDQSASQQEIMDYLVQQLEAQRAIGQLPPQIEAVELAKIEELKKRGLFSEVTRDGMVFNRGGDSWIHRG